MGAHRTDVRRRPAGAFGATALLAAILLAGCGGRAERTDQATSRSGAASPAGARRDNAPSSDEMCGEHGVLEVVCTKCHPALAAVFQSKGDWCPEHGLPESFCPICHPERGGRPAVEVAGEEPPAHGLRVKLGDGSVAGDIGLETSRVLPGGEGGTILATATLVADNARLAVVNARAAGVLRAFLVEIGASVRKGAALATLESADLAEHRAHLEQARAALRLAESTAERERELGAKGVSPARVVQEAEQGLATARAELASARAALAMTGASEEASEGGRYTLVAPIAGIVTRRESTVGALVEEGMPLFEVVDTSTLWAEIDVPESQARYLHPGLTVELEIPGSETETFRAVLSYVAPLIDQRTRTIRARAVVANEDGRLRANTFARARITAAGGSSSALVPRAAVQRAKGASLVFVPIEAGVYETRRVHPIPSDGELIAVLDGVSPGEEVVTTGSFLLKTETLKESIGAGCCEVDPPK